MLNLRTYVRTYVQRLNKLRRNCHLHLFTYNLSAQLTLCMFVYMSLYIHFLFIWMFECMCVARYDHPFQMGCFVNKMVIIFGWIVLAQTFLGWRFKYKKELMIDCDSTMNNI